MLNNVPDTLSETPQTAHAAPAAQGALVRYFDSAASTPLRPEAFEAMRPYFDHISANPSGHYASARRAADALTHAHQQIAHVLGAIPEEIICCSGGTESINAAIKGVALAQREAGGGAHIITTAVEHHAVIESVRYLERFGFEVEIIPVDHTGRVDPQDIFDAIRDDTVLISVMYANNEVGTIQPIATIGQMLRDHAQATGRRIPFHTDAVQAATSLPLDVDTLGVDLLSLSAHKFGGPRGAGILYIRRGTPYLELLSGGGQERQRRSGTEDVAGAVGMATALTLAAAEREQFTSRTEHLRARLLAGIQSTLPDAHITGAPAPNEPWVEHIPSLLHLCIDGVEGESIVEALDTAGFETSAGAACTSATWEPSHVLLAMDIPLELAIGSLRISLWPTLTETDIDALIAALPRAVERARLAAQPAL